MKGEFEMSKSYNSRNVLPNGTIYDPTAHRAMNKVIHDQLISQGKTRTIEINEKHHEVTIVTTDGRGHTTRVSSSYENEQELRIIIR